MQPRNPLKSIFQLKVFVIIVEAKNANVNNSQILVKNLTVWIGCILIGGFIYLFMQKSAGINVDDLSTPFLDLTRIFFGYGGIRAKRSFIRIFVIGTLFGAFFFNSIFSGNLFNSYTSESENKIDTFDKLSKVKYTYYFDEIFKYHVGIINDTMRYRTGLIMNAESAKPKFLSELILINKMPFAYILFDLQIVSLKTNFGHLADFTVIPDPLCMDLEKFIIQLFILINLLF